jgi:predicted permease
MLLALWKTFLVLIVGILSGYLFQKLMKKHQWLTDESLRGIAIFLQKLGMIWLISITYIGSLWIFEIESLSGIISLPFVGSISIVAGGVYAVILSKCNHYDSIDTGSMFSCGFFANTASLGGMICFYYLGEEGYALVPIYNFFMRFLYYGIGYPIANMYSTNFIKDKKMSHKIIEVIKDPFFYIGIGAVLVGLFLNLSAIERPPIYAPLNEVLVPLTTFVLLFSVGMNLKLSRISKYIRECSYISFIKIVALPLTTLIIVLLLNYQSINNGLPLKVSLIMSAMPVAFNSVIAANIYNLNIDLVNSCWIFTTVGVKFVLPLLLLFINLF